jgi:type IV pilus assembly protein PilP
VETRRAWVAAIVSGALWLGCSGEAEQPAEKPRAQSAPASAPAASSESEGATAEYNYDPTNKRDPFRSFVKTVTEEGGTETPLERFDLSQLSVTAIVWGVDPPRALIRDPAGKGYIVVEGTIVGKNKGRIIAIEDNLVRVKETYVDALGRAATKSVEMRLRETQGG